MVAKDGRGPPVIARASCSWSRPPSAKATVPCCAPQSETTQPSKAMPRLSHEPRDVGFAHAYVPLMPARAGGGGGKGVRPAGRLPPLTVERAHHGADAGSDGSGVGRNVELKRRALADARRVGRQSPLAALAVILLRVEDEVLHARGDVVRLDARDEGGSERGVEHGVLGHVLCTRRGEGRGECGPGILPMS